jgi:hypothetical protein
MRLLQRGLAAPIVLGVAAQFFLAAAGAFGATSYSAHRTLGWALGGAVIAAVLVALVIRRYVLAASFVLAAMAVQIALGSVGTTHHWAGAFHGLNALFVMGSAGNLARLTARGRHSTTR